MQHFSRFQFEIAGLCDSRDQQYWQKSTVLIFITDILSFYSHFTIALRRWNLDMYTTTLEHIVTSKVGFGITLITRCLWTFSIVIFAFSKIHNLDPSKKQKNYLKITIYTMCCKILEFKQKPTVNGEMVKTKYLTTIASKYTISLK